MPRNFIAIAAAAVALVALAPPAGAQTTPAPRPATLTVNGSGSVDRSPDRAIVMFAIVTNDAAASRAAAANNAAYTALTGKLTALGLSGSAVKTTSYSITYNARPTQPNPQFAQRYGYVVTRNVRVTDDRTDRVGAIVDAGVATGVTEVDNVSFTLRDGRSAYRAALAGAVADADAQAHALADAAHVRLVRILTVSTGGIPIGRTTEVFATRAMPAPPMTEIPASDLTINGNVSVTYEIAP